MSLNKPTCQRGIQKRLTLSKALVFATIGAIMTGSTTHAQSPESSRRMGYTTINDALYIQGGYITEYINQFVVLDLSKSWTTDDPAWKTLKSGFKTSHLALAPISSATSGGSQGSVIAIGGSLAPSFFNTYDISSNAWSAGSTKSPYPNLEGHAAVSDPNTGLIYIMGGYGTNNNNNTIYNDMTVYDPKSNSVVSSSDTNGGGSLTDIGAVWASTRNTILTFGGSRANSDPKGLGSGDLNEYDPSTKEWNTMSTTGDVPPPRLDHCMAVSEDGKKIVVFGGTSDRNDYYNTIYILDVKSGVWKQGQTTPVARTRMACAFHSYQFIAWGGSSGSSAATILNSFPIVYNLNNDAWTDKYDPDEKEKKTPVGGIVGGIIGVFAVCAIGGFLLYKRNQKKKEERAAFYTDAAAAAAISASESDADNIKVSLADDSPGVYNNGYGNYNNNYNEYPLNNVGSTEGYGADQYYQQSASTPGGSEKYLNAFSPAPSHYYPAGTVGVQSPEAAYLHHYDPNNPFVSPEDYNASASHMHSPYSPANQYSYPPTSPWPAPNSYVGSPSVGGRSPQVIVESIEGYVPPPPR
ncbi:hypothetical protein BGZ76_008298 [Entomortierella beljakovae]|nr:hypothetical protein BGZ76_008298 [Entomortierella beljakovae]